MSAMIRVEVSKLVSFANLRFWFKPKLLSKQSNNDLPNLLQLKVNLRLVS
jgi:hypothetical protein